MSFLFPFLKNITIFASFHVLGMFSRITNKVSSGKISLYDFFTGVCVRVPVRVCVCVHVCMYMSGCIRVCMHVHVLVVI